MSRLPSPAAWNGTRVLVTGHTGFKGAWLCHWLSALGARVHGFALQPREGSLYTTSGVNGLLDSETIADICDSEAVSAAVRRIQPEIVIHLAGMALVADAHADPARAFAVNAGGTMILLAAIGGVTSCRAVVPVTTDKVYAGRPPVYGFCEGDPLGPDDPYGASKAAAEMAVIAWRNSAQANCPVATARAGNCIGGGDVSPARLIPDAVRAWRISQPMALRSPDAIRPWQHVLDPLCGYLLLAERLSTGTPLTGIATFNFGPDEDGEATVAEVLELLAKNDIVVPIEKSNSPFAPESAVLRLGATYARHALGWEPRWALPEVIARTAQFYIRASRGEATRNLVQNDINDFTAST